MKAFLLAAGYGTRLRPITETIPKCLVPIQGRPMLGWWFELLQKHGVNEVLINTHYLPELVRDFISEENRKENGFIVHEVYEPMLLGSGGTIRENRKFVSDEESFLICYADNLTNADLSAFLKFHQRHDSVLSMALFRTNLPEQCGIAALDSQCRITEFEEKPQRPKSNLANAGIYVARQPIFEELPNVPMLDFGKDVLPKLVGRMYGWQTECYHLDIGTMENYRLANQEWRKER